MSLIDHPLQIEPIDNAELTAAVMARWNSLTKPPGSLGRLESILLQLALIQGTSRPSISRRGMAIFCGDHGVTEEGVSAYPREVTAQMVKNFLSGGAAISVLCRRFGITPVVIDAGVAGKHDAGTVNLRLGPGTANLAREPAMTIAQAEQALENGRQLAASWRGRFDVAAAGEMGIGNTTSASALLCAFADLDPAAATGPGAGLDPHGICRKAECIRTALTLHRQAVESRDPVAILAAVGGFEIATMAGFLLGAAEQRIPVVVDGFISSSAALVAHAIAPLAKDYMIFSHASAEPAHRAMLRHLRVEPVFDLSMRLGEGSGAAIVMPLLDAAHALYTEMATFEEAAVSGGNIL